ncbi:hypothetical protein D3C80_2222520 [compost metagenome]
MRLAGLNTLEVAVIGSVFQRHHLGEVGVVFFLEYLRVLSRHLAGVVVLAVLSYFVDKE